MLWLVPFFVKLPHESPQNIWKSSILDQIFSIKPPPRRYTVLGVPSLKTQSLEALRQCPEGARRSQRAPRGAKKQPQRLSVKAFGLPRGPQRGSKNHQKNEVNILSTNKIHKIRFEMPKIRFWGPKTTRKLEEGTREKYFTMLVFEPKRRSAQGP